MNVFTPSSPAPLTTAGIAVAPSGRVAALSAGRSEAWTTAINHRFVNELFSGELDDAQLTHYVIQDNQFFSFLSWNCWARPSSVPKPWRRSWFSDVSWA
ncbi:thiaminase II [Cutibacterium acnes JCM 18909]|nr:thiaminase II [Cutibacterium acnes JCM 18909]